MFRHDAGGNILLKRAALPVAAVTLASAAITGCGITGEADGTFYVGSINGQTALAYGCNAGGKITSPSEIRQNTPQQLEYSSLAGKNCLEKLDASTLKSLGYTGTAGSLFNRTVTISSSISVSPDSVQPRSSSSPNTLPDDVVWSNAFNATDPTIYSALQKDQSDGAGKILTDLENIITWPQTEEAKLARMNPKQVLSLTLYAGKDIDPNGTIYSPDKPGETGAIYTTAISTMGETLTGTLNEGVNQQVAGEHIVDDNQGILIITYQVEPPKG